MKIEQITTALHNGEMSEATLLVAREITYYRALRGSSIAAATEEIHRNCERTYTQQYKDREDFDFVWAGVEGSIRSIFE